jgi:hypothetical protein
MRDTSDETVYIQYEYRERRVDRGHTLSNNKM